MSETAESPLAEAMNRLWAKYLPQIEERVATLRAAGETLVREDLPTTERQRACSEAHKLAGVLGTFGLQKGTELAREAESLCDGALTKGSPAARRLVSIAEKLHVVIASRK